jgi:hypothetical protein
MAQLKNTLVLDTQGLVLPAGTSLQRTAGAVGDIRFNTTHNQLDLGTGAGWLLSGMPYLYYNEGPRANLFLSNWNDTTTSTMANMGDLGYVTAHGWNTGPATFTLTLNNLPPHTVIRYCVFWHLVDSLDNETNQLFLRNNSNTETEFLRFTKVYNAVPAFTIKDAGTTAAWLAGLGYTYRPWGNGSFGQDGYIIVDTGYYSHTLSTFTARHVLGANQPVADEAEYLSHVQVWLGA